MGNSVEWCTVVWQVAGENFGTKSDLATWGVALLSGFMGMGGIVVGQLTSTRTEKKSVRAAVLAEVEALHDLCMKRKYLEGFREDARHFRSPEGIIQQQRGEIYQNSIRASDFNLIYRANLSRLGGLSGTEAKLIVRFHQLLQGVLQDVSEGGILFEGSNDPKDYEEAADILEEAMDIAKVLMAQKKPWWRFPWRCGQNVDTATAGKSH
ncbi:hypothetical protein Q7C30_001100 [Pseudomonas sp. RAC1]|uniref:hypothetical protein n=1 Tax=Pseudomonas sp. RAC1 TaxID=3064900 RepID=UPI002720747D|nr:hypothetical protein [Pseudomonas sp. RAC1]MDV9030700.1 hypothetical protein [Pseudomonas sp. RAC1]